MEEEGRRPFRHAQKHGSGSHQEASQGPWASNEKISFRITTTDACMFETGFHGAQAGLESDMELRIT